MLSYMKVELYSFLFHYVHNEFLVLVSMILSLNLFLMEIRELKERAKVVTLIGVTAIGAFVGARIFHVLIENRDLLKSPNLIFTRFDGMTFNGSLFFGIVVFFLGLMFFEKKEKSKLWDTAAIATSLSYGLLRIGCFANGCCWGKISAVPWSVKYHDSSVMPLLGIPVHPVQLYDAVLGLSMAAILFYFKKKDRWTGKLFPLFVGLYGTGRFCTEFFRGDSFRGENIFGLLSTSQVISVVLIIFSILYFVKVRKMFLIFPAFFLTGCFLPKAPSPTDFRMIHEFNKLEIYQSKNRDSHKNVLFVAADDNIQFVAKSVIQAFYQEAPVPRVEDLAWWLSNSKLRRNYNIILRIPPNEVSYIQFQGALEYLESLNQPYDVFILTHGMPNYLSTGKGYFYSYRELVEQKGRLQNLNMVFMQSCYGASLVQDWKNSGAKSVIAYEGLNTNFVFYDIFLTYSSPSISTQESFNLALNNLEFMMTHRAPYYYLLDYLKKSEFSVSKKILTNEEALKKISVPNIY